MDIDLERTTNQDVIQIGSMDVPIGEDGKRPIVPNNKVVTSTPGVFIAANDHEASGSGFNSKYFLPRWCPPDLTRPQRRKLQHLRFQRKEVEGAREVEGRSFQSVQAYGSSRKRVESQRLAPSQHRLDRWRSRSNRSDRWRALVRPMTQRRCPVSLLRLLWFVMTSPHRNLHQKTMRSLLITVLHPSA
jgi:hypothetical protein